MNVTQALEVLELKPNATLREMKQAYRGLAKAWHPDRFANDERLRQLGEEKLKRINEAYQALLDYQNARPTQASSSTQQEQARRSSTHWNRTHGAASAGPNSSPNGTQGAQSRQTDTARTAQPSQSAARKPERNLAITTSSAIAGLILIFLGLVGLFNSVENALVLIGGGVYSLFWAYKYWVGNG